MIYLPENWEFISPTIDMDEPYTVYKVVQEKEENSYTENLLTFAILDDPYISSHLCVVKLAQKDEKFHISTTFLATNNVTRAHYKLQTLLEEMVVTK